MPEINNNSETKRALWQPSQSRIDGSHLKQFQQLIEQSHNIKFNTYKELHQWSVDHYPEFWSKLWGFSDIKYSQPWDNVINFSENSHETPAEGSPESIQSAQWFAGAKLNVAENLLRHCNNKAIQNKAALVFHSETGLRESISYQQLYQQVAKLSASFRQAGLKPGDRVAAYMPNRIETIVAMLASSAIGAVWSSCSPDFGIQGVLDRFGQIEPKFLIATDGYYYNGKTINCLDKVAELSRAINSVELCIVVPYVVEETELQAINNAMSWDSFINAPKQAAEQRQQQQQTHAIDFAQLPFDHPLYILYSSGTTGVPKCIVHGAGGTLLQHCKEHLLHLDLKQEDVFFYFTTCGWMMWNWLVSGLAHGTTLILFDGAPSYPSMNILLDLIEQEKITIFGTSAKFISALEKAQIDTSKTKALTSLKTVLSTGSPLAPESYHYVYENFPPDICLSSISGGTDIVSCFILGSPTLPVWAGELQCAGLGMAMDIYDDEGKPLLARNPVANINKTNNSRGELVCTKPFPSRPIMFWQDENNTKYIKAYFSRFPGVWAQGDFAETTVHGGYIIHGRSDAVLNPGGVRIGTAEIYRQVETIDSVLESLVIGQDWQGDVRIVLFVKLKPNTQLDTELAQAIKNQIRNNTTPRHVPAKIIAVSDIPRTLSGKIVELAVRNVVHGQAVKNKDALANPEALDYFKNLPELSV